MAGKKPGGDAPKKPSVAYSFIGEAAEFATGVVAGQVFSSVLRAGATGAINALKGSLFKEMFSGIKAPGKTPEKSDTIDSGEIETAKKRLRKLFDDKSGDAKLAGMVEDYVTAVVGIQLSSRPDKTEAINIEKTKFKAAVNDYLLGKAKQSLQSLMAELSDLDKKGDRVEPPGRPHSYRTDFMQWLNTDLTPTQHDIVMARRSKITSVRIITDMLDLTPANAVERFEYLTFALGEPSFTEQGEELVNAVLNGRLEQHPIVQNLEVWSSSNAADREELTEMETRCYANRRKV
ncbi:MAG: hypothetical protein PHC53_04650 [Patescibacteria group bacterium]|nr:hypothetical protein [Patescibacteria group bacterium]